MAEHPPEQSGDDPGAADDPASQSSKPAVNTWCHACDGGGHVATPRMGVFNGRTTTLVVGVPCKWCNGTGRLNGMRPPV